MSILVKFIIWKDGGDIENEGMCANGGMDRLGMVCMIHDRQCHPKMSFFRKQKNGKLNYRYSRKCCIRLCYVDFTVSKNSAS
jgi:hypothetical protein